MTNCSQRGASSLVPNAFGHWRTSTLRLQQLNLDGFAPLPLAPLSLAAPSLAHDRLRSPALAPHPLPNTIRKVPFSWYQNHHLLHPGLEAYVSTKSGIHPENIVMFAFSSNQGHFLGTTPRSSTCAHSPPCSTVLAVRSQPQPAAGSPPGQAAGDARDECVKGIKWGVA